MSLLLRHSRLLQGAIIVCLILCDHLNSQNLVPNYSFEQYTSCPTYTGQINHATGWSDAYGNTSEYFNPCGVSWLGVPNNDFGSQAAADGNAYVGFRAWTYGMSLYFEFPCIALTTPLVACQLYHVSYKVSRAAGSQGGGFATDKLGVAFFDSVLTTYEFSNALFSSTFSPQITHPAGSFITDTSGWTTVSGTYLAHGGEIFMVIGNFENLNTNTIWIGPYYFSAYYYVDDVHVEPVQSALGEDLSICIGDTIALQLGVNGSVNWSDGSSNPILPVFNGGTYWVTATTGSCTVSDTIVVTQYNYPVFDLGNDTVLCEGDRMKIGADIPGNYFWNTGSGSQYINPDTTGIFELTVSQNGCASSDSLAIQFEDCIYIPNAFSPNSDNQNDVLFVRGYKSGYFHFSIFDRWGTMVFETFDPNVGWDGKVNGQPAIVGVYTYYAELDSHAHEGRYVKQGTVSLIR